MTASRYLRRRLLASSQIFEDHAVSRNDGGATVDGIGHDAGHGAATFNAEDADLADGLTIAGDEQFGVLLDAGGFACIDHHKAPIGIHGQHAGLEGITLKHLLTLYDLAGDLVELLLGIRDLCFLSFDLVGLSEGLCFELRLLFFHAIDVLGNGLGLYARWEIRQGCFELLLFLEAAIQLFLDAFRIAVSEGETILVLLEALLFDIEVAFDFRNITRDAGAVSEDGGIGLFFTGDLAVDLSDVIAHIGEAAAVLEGEDQGHTGDEDGKDEQDFNHEREEIDVA